MTHKWICRTCHGLLGKGRDATLRLKNKSEETVVTGKDFVVRKTCRRCGTRNRLTRPDRPQ